MKNTAMRNSDAQSQLTFMLPQRPCDGILKTATHLSGVQLRYDTSTTALFELSICITSKNNGLLSAGLIHVPEYALSTLNLLCLPTMSSDSLLEDEQLSMSAHQTSLTQLVPARWMMIHSQFGLHTAWFSFECSMIFQYIESTSNVNSALIMNIFIYMYVIKQYLKSLLNLCHCPKLVRFLQWHGHCCMVYLNEYLQEVLSGIWWYLQMFELIQNSNLKGRISN